MGVPPAPQTIEDVTKQFDRPEIFDSYGKSKHADGHETFLDYIHNGSDYKFMIFSSKRIIKLIQKNIQQKDRKYMIDATFYIVPYGCFKQLLIIHIEKFDTVHPFVFVLMDKRTAPAYTHVFDYINKNIFDLSAVSFNTDFEKAIRNSLRHCFPQAKLIPCWFHHKQAVRKKASQLPVFFHLIQTNDRAAHLYQKYQALALLKAELIVPAFDSLTQVALTEFGEKFQPFVDYFRRQWINNVRIYSFHVYEVKKILYQSSDKTMC